MSFKGPKKLIKWFKFYAITFTYFDIYLYMYLPYMLFILFFGGGGKAWYFNIYRFFWGVYLQNIFSVAFSDFVNDALSAKQHGSECSYHSLNGCGTVYLLPPGARYSKPWRHPRKYVCPSARTSAVYLSRCREKTHRRYLDHNKPRSQNFHRWQFGPLVLFLSLPSGSVSQRGTGHRMNIAFSTLDQCRTQEVDTETF